MTVISGGVSQETLEAGIKEGYRLTERILKLHAEGGLPQIAGPRVNDLFLFMQWRLARLARHRAERYDHEGLIERSVVKAVGNGQDVLERKPGLRVELKPRNIVGNHHGEAAVKSAPLWVKRRKRAYRRHAV